MRARNIVLVGFVGTGKTTIGQALSEALGWRFADTDQAIEQREGCSIPELFERRGEAAFRDAETQVLRETLSGEGQVVSTGGGAVLRRENREIMLSSGVVVALTAPPEVLLARMAQDENRPLLSGNKEERVHRLLRERKNAYDFAHIRLDTSVGSVSDCVREIAERAGLAIR